MALEFQIFGEAVQQMTPRQISAGGYCLVAGRAPDVLLYYLLAFMHSSFGPPAKFVFTSKVTKDEDAEYALFGGSFRVRRCCE